MAEEILVALHDRDMEAAYALGERILFEFDLDAWISGRPEKTATALYAIGQILSRHCFYRAPEFGAARDCQIERIDKALGIGEHSNEECSCDVADCSLSTAARLTFYYAISALHRKRYGLAAMYFADVLRDGQRLTDYDLQANAHFYLSICDRKLGVQPGSALSHLKQAREVLTKLKSSAKRIAVVDIHIAWEDFRAGNFEDAVEKAKHAIDHYGTDHSTLAHAQSLLARIERRRLRYDSARRLTESAISNFIIRDRHHRALARTYANLAHTSILILQTSKHAENTQELIEVAAAALNSADQIYNTRHYDRGARPEVGNLRAQLQFHQGLFDTAHRSAEEVYNASVARDDYVEMSTARIIQCMCHLHDFPTGRNGPSNIEKRVQLAENALKCAESAVDAAAKLAIGRHPRRRARAQIWLGRVLLRWPFFDLEAAANCRNKALDLLPQPKEAAGYIGEELKLLDEELKLQRQESEQFAPASTPIFTLTLKDVLQQNWRKTKQWIEDVIISSLVHRAGMTDKQICESIKIRQADLTKIKARCIEEKLIIKAVIDKRKGRKRAG